MHLIPAELCSNLRLGVVTLGYVLLFNGFFGTNKYILLPQGLMDIADISEAPSPALENHWQ